MRAFGIDVSRYDGLLDWDRLESHKPAIAFIAFRATISWGYRDSFFTANWREAGRRGKNRAAYHVVYPKEDPTRQMDNFYGHIGADIDERVRYVLDTELDHGASRAAHTACLRKMADIIYRRSGVMPILYSRANYLDANVDMTQLPDLPLWLAHYLRKPEGEPYAAEHPGPPTLPRGRTDWLIHQTGDQMPNICATSGKRYQDYNRWNGTEDDVNRYFGRDTGAPDKSNALKLLEDAIILIKEASEYLK